MAKRKGRRRKWRKYVPGQIDDSMSLLTLASKTVTSQILDDTVEDTTWVSSMDVSHALMDFTSAPNDGPVMVGIAHSDYTSDEIDAWIENLDSWNIGNKIAQEITRRQIKKIGVFHTPMVLSNQGFQITLNDGKPIHTKLGWMLLQGQSLQQWAYNLGTGALTTGCLYMIEGTVHLWPQ